MDEQYDVPRKIRELYEVKKKLRNEAKAYYAKYMENPHRPIGEGSPFDPVLFRYTAMEGYRHQYFRPAPKNIFIFWSMIGLPVAGYAAYLYHTFTTKEEKFRNGLVSYEDRPYKLAYC